MTHESTQFATDRNGTRHQIGSWSFDTKSNHLRCVTCQESLGWTTIRAILHSGERNPEYTEWRRAQTERHLEQAG